MESRAGHRIRERGAPEGRAAFKRALRTARMPAGEKRRVAAIFLAIYSVPFWELGRKRGGLSGADAIAAAEWATSALMQSLRKTTSLVTHASFVKLKPKQLNDSPHIEEVNSQVFRFLDSVFLSSAGSGMSFREISCSVYSTQFLSKYLALSSGCTQDLQSEWRFHVDVQRRH